MSHKKYHSKEVGTFPDLFSKYVKLNTYVLLLPTPTPPSLDITPLELIMGCYGLKVGHFLQSLFGKSVPPSQPRPSSQRSNILKCITSELMGPIAASSWLYRR